MKERRGPKDPHRIPKAIQITSVACSTSYYTIDIYDALDTDTTISEGVIGPQQVIPPSSLPDLAACANSFALEGALSTLLFLLVPLKDIVGASSFIRKHASCRMLNGVNTYYQFAPIQDTSVSTT